MAAENTTAHTEAPGSAHSASFPPFERETFPSQLFWLAICFVALYLITARLVQPRVGGIIENRKNRIAGDLAEADRFKREADDAMAAYEKALAEARARAHAIATETHDKLQAEAERNRKALDDQLNAQLAQAEKAIAATKAAAMANVRGIAVEAAVAIVARLTGVTASETAAAAAVDAALKR
ncbi:MAG TPA: F0F1 ATP synthase subunit B [Xanthobacteraceae bacterium]|jgi:F-type H+-transporting ATPase subunit b|nr:F0F1 ATP synthase subunit B [Xanthobacteraceae bacterium]